MLDLDSLGFNVKVLPTFNHLFVVSGLYPLCKLKFYFIFLPFLFLLKVEFCIIKELTFCKSSLYAILFRTMFSQL